MRSHFEGAESIAHRRQDFSFWHHGRSHYAVWIIEIADVSIEQLVSEARQHLAGVLLEDYRRQLHVTLGVCGFPASIRRYDDDFLPSDLAKQLQALSQAKLRPFVIEIAGLDSFASAPFLQIKDGEQGIARLRACLQATSFEHLGFRYTPHLTVGLYGKAHNKNALFDSFDRFTAFEPLRYEVRCLQWVCYDANDIGGPLQCLAEYDFEQNRLHWQADSRCDAGWGERSRWPG